MTPLFAPGSHSAGLLPLFLTLAALTATSCAAGPEPREEIEDDEEAAKHAGEAADEPMIQDNGMARLLATERPEGALEVVALFDEQMPTGVTVSPEGRIFVNFPRWQPGIPFTVAEIIDGEPVPYPTPELNDLGVSAPSKHLMSVQSVVIDPRGDRLWALDTGRPLWEPARPGGPKLVAIDLATNQFIQTIVLPPEVALKTTYLNDVRFDLRRGEEGMAFITDSSGDGPNAIIVVDLKSGKSWRHLDGHASVSAEPDFLPIVEGRPMRRDPGGDADPAPLSIGADGIALSADGERLYFRPLAGRHLFSAPLDLLEDPDTSPKALEAAVTDHGALGFASDGLHGDAAGNLYLTNYEDNAVVVWRPDTGLTTLLHDPRLLWPDTLAIAGGFLYVTANQLHRQAVFNAGHDERNPPYVLFRTRIGTEPVRLLSK